MAYSHVMKKAQIRLSIQQKMLADDEKALEIAESHNAVHTVAYLKARMLRTRDAMKNTQDIIDEQLKMEAAAKTVAASAPVMGQEPPSQTPRKRS